MGISFSIIEGEHGNHFKDCDLEEVEWKDKEIVFIRIPKPLPHHIYPMKLIKEVIKEPRTHSHEEEKGEKEELLFLEELPLFIEPEKEKTYGRDQNPIGKVGPETADQTQEDDVSCLVVFFIENFIKKEKAKRCEKKGFGMRADRKH